MKNKSFKSTKRRKSFSKGDQCVQNPNSTKFRSQVKRNVISQRSCNPGLTEDTLEQHNEQLEEDAISNFGALTVSEVPSAAESQAFSISGLTDCSNITFHKVFDKWHSSAQADREKCAILAAVTEVIRDNGGKETEAEYYAALMTVLAATEDLKSIGAIVYLISLVIKKISNALLKAKFAEASKCFAELLEKHGEDGKTATLICLLECLSALISAQEAVVWTEPSTQRYFLILLSFTVHTKPKVRKSAHFVVKSALKVCLANQKNHPAGVSAASFCMNVLEKHETDRMTTTHHALNFLKTCLCYFGIEHVKKICEGIIRLMLLNDVVLRTNSLQTLNSLFSAHPPKENLSADLNKKIIMALYDFQPSVNDVNVVSAWLTVMQTAHENLSLIKGANMDCIQMLPKYFGVVLPYLMSQHKGVINSTVDSIKFTTEACICSELDILVEDIEGKGFQSAFHEIFSLLEAGMKYKYQPVWNRVLQILAFYFEKFGHQCGDAMIKCVVSLIDLHETSQFPFMNDLNKAVGAAMRMMGPRRILEAAPLNLLRNDDVCEFPRGWLLPLMKDHIEGTELQYFISSLLPVAAQLRQKALLCVENKQEKQAKVYKILHNQIWALLPGFCTNPTDLETSFKNIAKILGSALMEREDLRALVLQSLRTLISKSTQDGDAEALALYTKNYLPILFNLYTSENGDCQSIALSVLETVKSFLLITDEKLISSFLSKMFVKLEAESEAKKRHKLTDLMVLMVKYASEDNVDKFYKLAICNVKSTDKSTQKKAYRVLEEMLDARSDACGRVIEANRSELMNRLSESITQAAPSSKAPRLRCLSLLIKKLSAEDKDFIVGILPEVILCTKEVGVKAKNAAFDLLVDIGSMLVFISPLPKEEVVQEYMSIAMAGLAGSPHMISATLLAFTKLVFEYRYCLLNELISHLLDSTIELLKSKTREVVKSALLFIRALVKILNADELMGHLESLVKNLFVWNSDKNNAYRQQMRVILERLHKKVGFEVLRSLVPEDHRKFIIHIHKSLERIKKQKDSRWQAALAEGPADPDEQPSAGEKSDTWESILEDTIEEEEVPQQRAGAAGPRKRERQDQGDKSWIMEGDDTVDLLDPSMARNVVGTKPKKPKVKLGHAVDSFALSTDGKMMIDEEGEGKSGEDNIDIGETNIHSGYDRAPKQIKFGKRSRNEDMPEDDDEVPSGYQPGGGGIHRRRDQSNDAKPQAKYKQAGEEYMAKKARGDMKVKGKPDPYAYLPFNRDKLNKRKKTKVQGQFSGVVKAKKQSVKSSMMRKKKSK